MPEVPLTWWIVFNAGVLSLLALDLFVFHRQPKAMSMRSASVMSSVWVLLSLSFCAWIWHARGSAQGMEFLTGYLVEYSLSVDNIFVFVMLFTFFKVPSEHQYRVLFWGVLGAILMRGALIGVGVMLVERFHWVLYIFGAFLVVTGIKMFLSKQDEMAEPANNPVLRALRYCVPISDQYHGKKFVAHHAGKWMLTPLAVVLVLVETTDLIFALDSIPAIFAITQDPFIVYSSNICAILGLRALYFVLAGCVHEFIFLKAGLSMVLTFIGCRMLSEPFFHIPTPVALGVVGAILATSIVTSIAVKRRMKQREALNGPPPGECP